MKVKCFNILWDTDGESQDKLGLPDTVTIDMDEGADVAEEGADVLSDQHGFCVHSFEFEILTQERPLATT